MRDQRTESGVERAHPAVAGDGRRAIGSATTTGDGLMVIDAGFALL